MRQGYIRPFTAKCRAYARVYYGTIQYASVSVLSRQASPNGYGTAQADGLGLLSCKPFRV